MKEGHKDDGKDTIECFCQGEEFHLPLWNNEQEIMFYKDLTTSLQDKDEMSMTNTIKTSHEDKGTYHLGKTEAENLKSKETREEELH